MIYHKGEEKKKRREKREEKREKGKEKREKMRETKLWTWHDLLERRMSCHAVLVLMSLFIYSTIHTSTESIYCISIHSAVISLNDPPTHPSINHLPTYPIKSQSINSSFHPWVGKSSQVMSSQVKSCHVMSSQVDKLISPSKFLFLCCCADAVT